MDKKRRNDLLLGLIFVVGVVCVVLGFDPFGQFVGQQGVWFITGAIILGVFAFEFISNRKKAK